MNYREEMLKEFYSMPFFNHSNITEDKEYDIEHHKGEVVHELKHHIKDNIYSKLFLEQFTQLHGLGYVEIDGYKHPYEKTQIYWTLESIIKKEVEYKEFTKDKSMLKGLGIYHVHHSQSFYIMNNFIKFFKKKYPNEDSLKKRIDELVKKNPNCNPCSIISCEAVIESQSQVDITGEWILFQEKNGKYYFIALALHDYSDKNDEKLYNKIKDEIKIEYKN